MWVTVKTHGVSNQWGTEDLARIDGTFVPDELLQWGLVPIFYSNFDTFKSFSNVSFCAYRGSSSFLGSSSIFTEDKLSHIHRDGLLTVRAPHFPLCPHPPMLRYNTCVWNLLKLWSLVTLVPVWTQPNTLTIPYDPIQLPTDFLTHGLRF